MEAARTSETLVNDYQTTRRCNPEDSHLRTHRRESLKSYPVNLIYLFIVYLTTMSTAKTIQCRMVGWLMNWKGYGTKWSRPNLRYYPSIHLEGPRRTTRPLSEMRYEPEISRIRSRSANHSTAKFGLSPRETAPRHVRCSKWSSLTSIHSRTRCSKSEKTRYMSEEMAAISGRLFPLRSGRGLLRWPGFRKNIEHRVQLCTHARGRQLSTLRDAV
jgi:hypothetical protein